jgi:hypothetical protein
VGRLKGEELQVRYQVLQHQPTGSYRFSPSQAVKHKEMKQMGREFLSIENSLAPYSLSFPSAVVFNLG